MTSVRVTVTDEGARRKMRGLDSARLTAALRGALSEIGEEGVAAIVQDARAVGIQQRTAQLLSNVTHWSPAQREMLSVNIGIPARTPASAYSYLLGGVTKSIRPKGGKKLLTIPTGDNLTGAGVPKYRSVAQLVAAFGERVVFNFTAGYIGLATKTGRGKLRIMFHLAPRVTVRGRDVLNRVATKQRPTWAGIVADQIRRELRRG